MKIQITEYNVSNWNCNTKNDQVKLLYVRIYKNEIENNNPILTYDNLENNDNMIRQIYKIEVENNILIVLKYDN